MIMTRTMRSSSSIQGSDGVVPTAKAEGGGAGYHNGSTFFFENVRFNGFPGSLQIIPASSEIIFAANSEELVTSEDQDEKKKKTAMIRLSWRLDTLRTQEIRIRPNQNRIDLTFQESGGGGCSTYGIKERVSFQMSSNLELVRFRRCLEQETEPSEAEAEADEEITIVGGPRASYYSYESDSDSEESSCVSFCDDSEEDAKCEAEQDGSSSCLSGDLKKNPRPNVAKMQDEEEKVLPATRMNKKHPSSGGGGGGGGGGNHLLEILVQPSLRRLPSVPEEGPPGYGALESKKMQPASDTTDLSTIRSNDSALSRVDGLGDGEEAKQEEQDKQPRKIPVGGHVVVPSSPTATEPQMLDISRHRFATAMIDLSGSGSTRSLWSTTSDCSGSSHHHRSAMDPRRNQTISHHGYRHQQDHHERQRRASAERRRKQVAQKVQQRVNRSQRNLLLDDNHNDSSNWGRPPTQFCRAASDSSPNPNNIVSLWNINPSDRKLEEFCQHADYQKLSSRSLPGAYTQHLATGASVNSKTRSIVHKEKEENMKSHLVQQPCGKTATSPRAIQTMKIDQKDLKRQRKVSSSQRTSTRGDNGGASVTTAECAVAVREPPSTASAARTIMSKSLSAPTIMSPISMHKERSQRSLKKKRNKQTSTSCHTHHHGQSTPVPSALRNAENALLATTKVHNESEMRTSATREEVLEILQKHYHQQGYISGGTGSRRCLEKTGTSSTSSRLLQAEKEHWQYQETMEEASRPGAYASDSLLDTPLMRTRSAGHENTTMAMQPAQPHRQNQVEEEEGGAVPFPPGECGGDVDKEDKENEQQDVTDSTVCMMMEGGSYSRSDEDYIFGGFTNVGDKNLIEAVLVEERSSNISRSFRMPIVRASEIEVSSEVRKPKRVCLVWVVALGAVAIGIVGLVLFFTLRFSLGEGEEDNPNMMMMHVITEMTPEERFDSLSHRLQDVIYDPTSLQESDSPQSQALSWMAFQDAYSAQLLLPPSAADPKDLPELDEMLRQRYLITVFFFSMTQQNNSPWSYCKPPETGEPATCIHPKLESYSYQGLYSDHRMREPSFRWLSHVSVCRWAGVKCTDGVHVVKLALAGYDLEGTLPLEVGYLSSLETLDLQQNKLYGTLPKEWGLLAAASTGSSLESLRLDRNNLSGSIPSEWCDLNPKGLREWDMSENQLTSTIPNCLGDFTSLETFAVLKNQLSGSIPVSITNLSTNLQRLHLASNNLAGKVPDEFCSSRSRSGDNSGHGPFEVTADCASSTSTKQEKQGGEDNAAVDCSCCTTCCLAGEEEELCSSRLAGPAASKEAGGGDNMITSLGTP